MYKIKLEESEREVLNKLIKTESNGKILKRLLGIKMHCQGAKNQEICSYLGISLTTITDWIKLYIEGGFDRLTKLNYEHNSRSKLRPHLDDIKKYISTNIVSNLSEVCHYIETEFGVKVDPSWLSRYLKKNSVYLSKKGG